MALTLLGKWVGRDFAVTSAIGLSPGLKGLAALSTIRVPYNGDIPRE
jgi:hypothetical protein